HMSPNHQNLALNFMNVDYNFQKLYGLEILEGRGFEVTDHNFSGDLVDKLIINESAVSYLGFKSISDAVGATLNFGNRDWMIIGIVEDYHQLTLHERIEPLALLPYLSTFNGYSIKLIGEPHSALISSIQERYDRIFPGNYFDYFFLSDQYAQYYQPEMRLRVISKVFTALSIVMVMLGLYGLTSMTLEKKVKEIGIRKVLGAKLSQLLFLLVKDFAFLMCIALFVGIPLSFYFIELWKADFAYSSQLGVRSIIAACALVLTFTSLPIIVQTGRIANHNPVQALRDE
ncbi:MAG: FtsX-like permease family protein, partial [Bacteroidota bacterium]